MLTKREIIRTVLEGEKPPYVPWSCGFTKQARDKLQAYYAPVELETGLQNHIVKLGSDIGFFRELGDQRVQDVFGVVWDRSIDEDIGNVDNCVLPQPTVAHYTFPDPMDQRFFADIPDSLERYGDRFRIFQIGFSLYERAWTLRGMQNLLMDFYDHPRFVQELFHAITDYNLTQLLEALNYDIDAVYFGDDWGGQHGLQMGPNLWRQFIFPCLERMYRAVHESGRYVFIHSCGDVDELFDELITIGVNCFNPFQPEVMEVPALFSKYHRRMCFYGGLSTQKTLPLGTVEEVRSETRHLLEMGREGGYIFAPAHDVQGDVPLENMLAFIELLISQPGFSEIQEQRPYAYA